MSRQAEDESEWTFYGFCSPVGRKPVQEWFSSLSDDERDEITDVLSYLQFLPIDRWAYPNFEHLGDGLSEVRLKVGRLGVWIRIYGMFWPRTRRRSYTLLYGCHKKVKNDTRGKDQAVRNKGILVRGGGSIHEFDF